MNSDNSVSVCAGNIYINRLHTTEVAFVRFLFAHSFMNQISADQHLFSFRSLRYLHNTPLFLPHHESYSTAITDIIA